ncbi:endonuclease III [Patescibacteria group bacterium]
MNKKERAKIVAKLLKQKYPKPITELVHKNETELAVAVMLSAQTTDKKVNEITAKLFKKYKSWKDYAQADLEELRADIRGVNFHKGKAERIIKAGKTVLEEFSGKLPKKIDALIKIPGVARKSANVIQQELWNLSEGIVVDTHVTRVSNLLGLTKEKNAVKIENDLMKLFKKDSWRNISGAIVLHGRYICKARKPNCEDCVLNEVCPSAFKE